MKSVDKEKLLREATLAKINAYAPYSKFRVGAAVLIKNSEVISGANVENASYPLTCCAERIAIFKAVSEGEKEFDTIVIRSNDDSFPYPCGACRQVMAQFSKDLVVYVVNGKNEYEKYTIKELLPHTFEF